MATGSKWLNVLMALLMIVPVLPAGFQEAAAYTTDTVETVGDFWNGTFNGTVARNITGGRDVLQLADENNWINRNTTPLARAGAAFAADNVNNYIGLMFGGKRPGNLGYCNDTLMYSYYRNIWIDMKPGPGPAPRANAQMVSIYNQKAFILFGGEDGSGKFNDTWRYDLTTGGWYNVTPATSPAARTMACLVPDFNTGSAILFSGNDSSGAPINDTWAFSPATMRWTNITPASSPPARLGAGMVSPSWNSYSVLFGGIGAGGLRNDTWIYYPGNNTWWNRTNPASSPPPRAFAGMCELQGYTNVWSGSNSTSVLGDMWKYDPWSSAWTERTQSGPVPAARMQMAFATINWNSIVSFGGVNGSTYYTETSIFEEWSGSWSTALPLAAPPVRTYSAMAYSPGNNAVLLWGGQGSFTYSDTWTYEISTGKWTNRNPASSPPVRGGMEMTYVSKVNRFILFGGSWAVHQNDTWSYDYNTNLWSNISTSDAPANRTEYYWATDQESGLTLLFGGRGKNGASWFSYRDTWLYNASANSWTNVTPASSPSYSSGVGMCYDSWNKVWLYINGYNVYSFNISTGNWTTKNPAAYPSAGYGSVTFDEENGWAVYQGGWQSGYSVANTWSYSFKNNTFWNATPANLPVACEGSSLVYVASGNYILMFGGITYIGTSWLNNDTSIYSYYSPAGTYTTRTFDGELTGSDLEWMSFGYQSNDWWNSGGISFQSASNNDSSTWNWSGPQGQNDSYRGNFDSSWGNYDVWTGHGGQRYLRVKSRIVSWDIGSTPRMDHFLLKYNRLPSSIALVSPEAGGIVGTSTPEFTLSAPDRDNDRLVYQIQIASDIAFGNIIRNFNQKNNLTGWSFEKYTPGATASYTVQSAENLSDGTYYWRARAWDERGFGNFSAGRTLVVDTHAPPVPALAAPAQFSNGTSVALSWAAVTDPSPGTGTWYRLELDEDPDFNSPDNSTGWFTTSTTATFNALRDGVTYYVRIGSRDGANNTLGYSAGVNTTMDARAPPVPFLNPEPPFTKGVNNTLGWNTVADAGIGGVQYLVQHSTESNFSAYYSSGWISQTQYTASPLGDALSYNYRIKSRDAFGWESDWSGAASSTQDNSAPTAPAISEEPGYTTGRQNTIYWDISTDAGIGGVQYDAQVSEDKLFLSVKSDSGWINGTHYTFTGLEDGKGYYYRVCSRDAFRLTGSWSFAVSCVQDDSAPAIPALDTLAPFTAGVSRKLSWPAVTDGNGIGNIEYYLEATTDASFAIITSGSGWIGLTGHTFLGLEDGVKYYYRAKSRDGFGHESGWSRVESSTQDASPPGQPILVGEPEYTPGQENSVCWTAVTDAGVGNVSYQLQFSEELSFATITGDRGYLTEPSYRATSLQDGRTYYFRVRARDGLGQFTPWSAVEKSTQDSAPPVTVVNSPLPGQAVGGKTLQVSGTSQDANGISILEISTDGGESWSLATGTSSWTFSWPLPADGTYSLKVRARDGVGRLESPARNIQFRVDNTSPRLTHLSPAPGSCAGNGTPAFWADIVETGAGINASAAVIVLDGKEYPATAGPDGVGFVASSTLASGEHSYSLRVSDLAGNIAQSPVVKFFVDTDWPVIKVTAPAQLAVTTNAGKLSVSGQITDATAIRARSIVNGAPGETTLAGADFSFQQSLMEGTNTLVLTAEDMAGHTTSVTFTIIRDSRGPIISLTGPDTVSSSRKATVAGQVSDLTNVTAVTVTVNGVDRLSPVTAGAFSADIALRAGSNSIIVKATDEAGNSATAARTTRVDEPRTSSGDIATPLAGAALGISLLGLVLGLVAFLASRKRSTVNPVEPPAREEPAPAGPEPAAGPYNPPAEPVPVPRPKKKSAAPPPPPEPVPVEEPTPPADDEFKP